MSRSDQYVGLNIWAHEFLTQEVKGREVGKLIYPDGTEVPYDREITINLVKREQYDTIEGAFFNEFPLWKYTTPDGKEYLEYEQASPWSSGPMFFIALKDSDGNPIKESLWTDRQIAEATGEAQYIKEGDFDDDGNYVKDNSEWEGNDELPEKNYDVETPDEGEE